MPEFGDVGEQDTAGAGLLIFVLHPPVPGVQDELTIDWQSVNVGVGYVLAIAVTGVQELVGDQVPNEYWHCVVKPLLFGVEFTVHELVFAYGVTTTVLHCIAEPTV